LSNFVLVHGAWHGGWCWKRVKNLLLREGHIVCTPTLTGLGNRSHLLSRDINLDTHILDIVRAIETEELTNVVLCGHSYGGVVITGVADRITSRIASVVYLDAFIPENGKSQRDLLPKERLSDMDILVKEKGEGWKAPPRNAMSFMVQKHEDREWVDRLCVDHPYATMTQPIKLTNNWKKIRHKKFIKATLYTTSPFEPFAECSRNDPEWCYEEIRSGHDVMIDSPEELASSLIAAAP